MKCSQLRYSMLLALKSCLVAGGLDEAYKATLIIQGIMAGKNNSKYRNSTKTLITQKSGRLYKNGKPAMIGQITFD